MTEKDWLKCADSQKMLEFLRGKASDRKLRLFACACCRRIWDLLPQCVMISEEEREVCRQAIVTAERYADGLAVANELIEFPEGPVRGYSAPVAFMATAYKPLDIDEVLRSAAEAAAYEQESLTYRASYPGEDFPGPDDIEKWQKATKGVFERGYEAEEQGQCHLLRCAFGNPFRPIALDPAWLTPTVLTLAQTTYDNHNLPAGTLNNDRLAVLADALEDTGASAAILDHLRSEGPHVRGCVALDLLLGLK